MKFLSAYLLFLCGIDGAFAKETIQLKFPSPTLQVETGRMKMIAFLRAGNNPAADLPPVTITPADQAEVVMPAKILEKEPVGYLRIRPLKPGQAVLSLGGASLTLNITPETTPKAVVEPRIVTPLAGAAVWGEIAVVAECFVPDESETTAVLRLPDGTDLFPQPLANEEQGPGRHYVFLVETSRWKTGENDLKVDVLLKGQPPISAEPVRVRAIAPKVEELLAGECEDTVNTPRPEVEKPRNPTIREDKTASGDHCVNNFSADPVWLAPVDVKELGEYQMMLVARGDAAVGAYPTVGLEVDGKNKPVTNGRVADAVWRRTAVGLPIRLEAGSHVVGVRFQNDFAEKKADRNLYLDRYEIARVDGPLVAANPENDGGTMLTEPNSATLKMETVANPPAVATGFKLNFSSMFDGKSIGGPVTLHGKCLLDDKARTHFPEIGLWLNNAKIATGFGPNLIFTIDPARFQPGKNVVQLRGQDSSGSWIESAPQRLFLPGATPPPGSTAHYFTMFDAAWDQSMQQRYEPGEGQRLQDSADWFSNGESALRLPDPLTGVCDLTLNAKGQNFKGWPIAEIAVRVAGQEISVLKTEIKGDWNEFRAGTLELPAGAKELVVRFVNDDSDGAKGDRNFWLKWIKLQTHPTETLAQNPGQKPTIAFDYWPQNQPVGLSDAVVASIVTPAAMNTADLLVDDVPQELAIDVSTGLNPIILPLLSRSLAPGSHRIKVVASAADGKKIESEIREIRISAEREPATGAYARAVKWLDRLGFGASPIDLTSLLVLGQNQWLAQSLMPDEEQRAIVRRAVAQRFGSENPNDNLVRQVLFESLVDPNPVRQRFVLWTENHFSTWMEKAGREKKRREHEAFARIGVASFSDLLFTSATSPAMLVYLDQQRSFAGQLNENYAREIMELHTLGVKGGYTQTDVTSLANLLTGWSMADQGDLEGTGGDLVGEFRYEPALNAGTPLQILGMEFPAASTNERFGRVQMALDLLAAYPSTGEFVSRKLAEHYVSDPAPANLVQEMGRIYASTGGDMKAVLTTMANSKAFWDSPKRIATPLDFSLRVARAAGLNDPNPIAEFLRRSGMGLFDHATPDGYPQEDDNYVSSNALMQRWRFAQKIEGPLLSLVPKTWRNEKQLTMPQTQRMLDLAATRLLGTCLSETSNQAAMDLLAKSQPNGEARARLIVSFLCQTPEAGLR